MAAWNFAVSLHISLVFVVVYGASPKILSITRSKDKGDSFELDLEPHGCPLCEQYGAMSDPMFGSSSTSGCFCQCRDAKPTFYSTQTGQHACLKDGDVLADTQGGDICDFYTGSVQQLQVHDLHTGGKTRVKPDGFCEQVQLSGWKFYFNTSWVNSTLDTFFTISSNKGTNKQQSFLFWHNNLDSFYKGFLIKVMLHCTYEGKTDDRCVMFKAQGTHQYFKIIPTTTPVMYKPTTSMSFTSTTEKNNFVQKSTASVEPTVLNPVPTDGYSKSSNKQIWLAVSLGLSGLVFIFIIVIAVCLWKKCRRNCKQKRTESHRHPVEQPTISTLCSATLHDYEYVHYPCLEERARTPPVIPRGNPMYERGADNKLIIWSPGHSSSLTRPHSQSAESAAPRLPYQRLLTRTSSSTPDCSMPVSAATAGPLSPVGVEEVFPYQKLVRTVPSLRRSDQGCDHVEESAAVSCAEAEVPYQKLVRSVPSLQRLQEEEQACGNTEESTAWVDEEEDSAKAYQSLSLQRKLYPLKECDGYAVVGSASEPESTEYDYARVSTVLDPVELDKLFRGNTHRDSAGGETSRSSVEISIGDLSNTASTIRHSGISRTHSTSSCSSGDYENCTCKDNAKRDSLANAVKDNECVEAKGPRPAASYEDLSGSHRLDPEEYEEMGKRKSVMITEESHDDASEAEDTGHEYFVLEGLVEECEDETVDES